jgi:glycosyltransferase involved in cell wall biosynthesis
MMTTFEGGQEAVRASGSAIRRLDDASTDARSSLAGKRVLIVLVSLELGGAERQALLLGRHLADKEGAQVAVWGFHGPGQGSDVCEAYGLPWKVLGWPWSDKMPTLVKRVGAFTLRLREARPDIVLPFTIIPNVVCGLTWRWAGADVFVWNQREGGLGRVEPFLERWAVRRTPAFVANSEHGARFLVNTLGAPPELVRVIRNGIALGPSLAARSEWRRRLDVSQDCFLACMVGTLSSYKDHFTLLKAWQKVINRSQGGDAQLLLLLAGRLQETYDAVRQLADDLRLHDTVKFLGRVDDVAGLLNSVDLGILSSRSEGCPNAVLEYMAAGLAVVGTDIPGIREAVGPEGTPFLAAVQDPDALSEQIWRMLMDRALRSKAGEANQRRIATEFSSTRMCQQMVRLITSEMGR